MQTGIAASLGFVESALFSLQGVQVQSSDGIVGAIPEETMQNSAALGNQGMIETARTILKIMLEKHCMNY